MDHHLDARALPPPEPLERVLDLLADLPNGDRVVLRHRREPFPLYDMLRQMGYRWTVDGEDGDYRILICSVSAQHPEPDR